VSATTSVRDDRELGTRLAAKPRRWGAWYVAEHKLRGMKAFAVTMIATALGTPFIYLYCFGIGLATLIGRSSGATAIDGVSYLQFLTPAVLCAFVIQAGSEESMFTILMGFKWNPIFRAMHAAPIMPRQILDGIVIMASIRMGASAVLYYLVAALFGAWTTWWSLLVIPIAVLTGLAFALPIMVYTTQLEDDRGQFAVINRVIVLPLSLFSGTMFPLDVLPVWLQWVGWLSPLWHGTQLARTASYGLEEPIWVTLTHIAYLGAIAIVAWQWARVHTVRRLEK
jgi:lipooligosaccharide transport system permease protein